MSTVLLGACVKGQGQFWRHIGSGNSFPDFWSVQELKQSNKEVYDVAKTMLGAPCVSIQDICLAQRGLGLDFCAEIVCNEDDARDFPRFLKRIIESLYLFSTDWVRTIRALMKAKRYTPPCLDSFAEFAQTSAAKSENPLKDIMRCLRCRRSMSDHLVLEVVDILEDVDLQPANLVTISYELLKVATLHGHRAQEKTPLRREFEMWRELQIACNRLTVVQCLCAQIVEINEETLPFLKMQGPSRSTESTIKAYKDYLSHFSVPEEVVKRYIV